MKTPRTLRLKTPMDYINLVSLVGIIVYLFIYRINLLAGIQHGIGDFTGIFK